uniref:homeobox protein engrailed-2a-like n=1 Tax=Ciona intestinalis TaxID=7719 RepID=UPI000EF4FE02|nr:homeobox protein engrailed-2a-like [Ciona intestinalis]|eukprot:XP_004226122.2 homeobox protein engrailed-2a-like [Ciona intestinalis]
MMAVSSSKHEDYKPTQQNKANEQRCDQNQNTKRVTPFSIDDILSTPKSAESGVTGGKTNNCVGRVPNDSLTQTQELLHGFYPWQQASYAQWLDSLRRLYVVSGLEPLLQAGSANLQSRYRGPCRRRSSANVLHGKGFAELHRKGLRSPVLSSNSRATKPESSRGLNSPKQSESDTEDKSCRGKRKRIENGGSFSGRSEQDQNSKSDDEEATASDSPLHALEKLTCSTLQYLEKKQPNLHTVAVGQEVRAKRRKCRTAFSTFQLSVLEQRFSCHKYLTPSDRDHIARALGLTASQVITWFQNRRAKLKRDLEELQNDIKTVNKWTPTKLALEGDLKSRENLETKISSPTQRNSV